MTPKNAVLSLAPSGRLIAAAGIATVAAVAPSFVGSGGAFAYVGVVVALIAVAAVDAARCVAAGDGVATLRGPREIFVGQTFDATATLRLPPGAAPTEIEVLVATDSALAAPPPARAKAAADSDTTIDFPLRALIRGPTARVDLWTRRKSPWLLWTRTIVAASYDPPDVEQDVRPVREAARRASAGSGVRPGLRTRLTPGEGSDFDSLREFARGHDRRALHWKASARHRKLLVRDFRAEAARHVVLAFDVGRLMSEPLGGVARLDHAVRAGLLLAYDATRMGDLVGAYSFDATPGVFHDPAAGAAAFRAVRAATAALYPRPLETNFTSGLVGLATRLKRRSAIVVFTDFADATTAELMLDHVGALARRHLVLFVALRDATLDATANRRPSTIEEAAAAAVAYEFVRERAEVLARLRRLGADVLDVVPEAATASLVDRYFYWKRRERL